MFPHVGLYLPETLQRDMATATKTPKVQRETHKITERRSYDRVSMSRKSNESARPVFNSVSTAFSFADFFKDLNEAESEIYSLVATIQRVREDLAKATQLRSSHHVAEYCQYWPEDKDWIDSVLLSIHSALNDIGVYVENVRVSSDEGGTVKMRQKFDWVRSHHHKVQDKQNNLLVCHRSLTAAIQIMHTIQMRDRLEASGSRGVIHEAPTQPWIQHEYGDHFRSPYMRQRSRQNLRNLSVPSITINELEEKPEGMFSNPNKLEHITYIRMVLLVNSDPVELPGSTPEDLPHPDNLDLYCLPSDMLASREKQGPNTLVSALHADSSDSDGTSKVLRHNNSIPRVGKRYRATRVQIRGPPRHRSLPTQLPQIPQTPSLIAELSRWVDNMNIESNGSVSTPELFDTPDTPSESVTPSPTVASASSCPERVDSFSSVTTSRSRPRNTEQTQDLERPPNMRRQFADSPTLPPEPFSTSSAPEKVTNISAIGTSGTVQGHRRATSLVPPSNNQVDTHENAQLPRATSLDIPRNTACITETNSSVTNPAPETSAAAPEVEAPSIQTETRANPPEEIPPPLPPRATSFNSIAEAEAPVTQPETRANSSEETPPIIPPRAASLNSIASKSPVASSAQDQGKPMTAQERRRRAHQRRMAAFAED